jgi:hypothetical protein
MRQRESDYRTSDYLHQPLLLSCVKAVDVECRAKMCVWCIQIVDHCHFSRETVAIAMNFLDRFLEASPWILQDRSAFQLAAITSLYTCVKVHEPQAIAVETMANLSRNVYPASQIEAMERVMLQATKWLVHPPSSFSFCYSFCQWIVAADPRYDLQTLLDLTKLQFESTLQDYQMSMVPSSSVAFAAVMNAMEGMALSSPQVQMELGQAIAGAAKIDVSTSTAIQDIQIRLCEGILGANNGDNHNHTVLHDSSTRSGCGSTLRSDSPRSVSAVVGAVSP